METPRPKFCISEVVEVESETCEIREMIYLTNQRIWVSWGKVVVYTGWAYKVNTCEGWVFEHQIKKADQPQVEGWLNNLIMEFK